MDDGEIEVSKSYSSENFHPSLFMDSILDDLVRNSQTCTHTHLCNPSSPDDSHTHTCYHTHTHLIQPAELCDTNYPVSNPRKPSKNREAVRKYREKKKAHAAYLETEVKKLRLMNQQLVRKLQKQAFLESEISKLRGIFFDIRGKIESESDDIHFGKQYGPSFQANMSFGECGKMMDDWDDDCQQVSVDCRANAKSLGNNELHDVSADLGE